VRGDACWVEDQAGHRVLDCNNNYTSLIHGHCPPNIVAATNRQLALGTAFGLPTSTEVLLAEHLAERTRIPSWRFYNSGTEAVMSAIRGARAHTGRDVILRFEGSYHGTYDAVVDAGSPGIADAIAQTSLPLPQGDLGAFDREMNERGNEVAAVILDLMPNRAGLVPANEHFVRHVREATKTRGVLLIVDEVITFRLAEEGLQAKYGADPDLVTVGKTIGGGFPIGGVGGRPEVMEQFNPRRVGAVSWGGTFSANPMSMVAGVEALTHFGGPEIARLNDLGDGLRKQLEAAGVKVAGLGSLIRLREHVDPAELWWGLYGRGILAGTNGLLSLSTPMGDSEVDRIFSVVTELVRTLRER
jgi:glutamate-1-semialdehyde 2,1-aminomutase